MIFTFRHLYIIILVTVIKFISGIFVYRTYIKYYIIIHVYYTFNKINNL